MRRFLLPVDPILDCRRMAAGEVIGRSREGRPLVAHRLGQGDLRVSLVGGCHADEPVGPAMLTRLAGYLSGLPEDDELLAGITWLIAPHVNPDGAERNRGWSETLLGLTDHAGQADVGFDLPSYARNVVRELPGDDIEFGFPRDPDDLEARPENRAVAEAMRSVAPLHLHGSFHGMAFAPGPWFLLDRTWIGRTAEMRNRLRRAVAGMGYGLLDWDRRGDKGFERIDRGFSTRPDSRAMRQHFLDLGDEKTAALFRPSSMETARSCGGDPLTFVSEMPLFLHPDPTILGTDRNEFREWLAQVVASDDRTAVREEIAASGIRPMPIRDQMRLQLLLLQEAIGAVALASAVSS